MYEGNILYIFPPFQDDFSLIHSLNSNSLTVEQEESQGTLKSVRGDSEKWDETLNSRWEEEVTERDETEQSE